MDGRWHVALALVIACGDPVPEASLAYAWPEEVHPGGALYVALIDGEIAEFEVTFAGERLTETRYVGPEGAFAYFDVPWETPLGPTSLVLRRGLEQQTLSIRVIEPQFHELADELGLAHVHETQGWHTQCAESLTGIGVADIDLDGRIDVFVGNLTAPSVAYRNMGFEDDGLPRFEEATEAFGLGGQDLVASVGFVDIDDDGDQDLFLGRRGSNRLLENRTIPDGSGFVDVTAAWGVPEDSQRTMGIAFGDYDGDADLDAYVVTHAFCFPGGADVTAHRLADHLLRNDGGSFSVTTADLPDDDGQVGNRFGFTALFVDYDGDLDQDLFVANDALQAVGGNVAFRNDGPDEDGWSFTDVTSELGFSPPAPAKEANSMGLAVADVDFDGRPDFALSNIGDNLLLVSGGDDRLLDVLAPAGVNRGFQPWGSMSITWGTELFDWDNDADTDLFIVGGDIKGGEPQPHLFLDNRGDGQFVDFTAGAGLDVPNHGKASAVVDLDEDGFPDLLVANWSGQLEVFRNTLGDRPNQNRFLAVALQGDGEAVTRDAFGTKVSLTTDDGLVQTCFHNPRPSLGATGERLCRFGLGQRTPIHLRVLWPDGTVSEPAIGGIDRTIVVTR